MLITIATTPPTPVTDVEDEYLMRNDLELLQEFTFTK